AVTMEVEVPAPVVVRITPPVDGHRMRIAPRERHAQRDALVAIHQQIVLAVARHRLDLETHATQPPRNGCTRHLMFKLTVHVCQPPEKQQPSRPDCYVPPPNFLPRTWDQRL